MLHNVNCKKQSKLHIRICISLSLGLFGFCFKLFGYFVHSNLDWTGRQASVSVVF